MNTFFDLFKLIVAGKPVNEEETKSFNFDVPNHQEDTSQGGEFVDDIIWETDESLETGNQPDSPSDLD